MNGKGLMKKKSAALKSDVYREMLVSKRAAILADLGEAPVDLTAMGHMAEDDQVTFLHDQFVSAQLKSLDYQTLQQINAALKRLDDGEFGVCASCGGAISPKRLAAIPWAACCLECQARTVPAGRPMDEWAA